MEVKVRILDTCPRCDGKAYIPVSEEVDHAGNKYTRHQPCPHCEGTGVAGKWVEFVDFALMLDQAKCPHKQVSRTGGFHYSNGDCWDDIVDTCIDCGEIIS